MPRWGWTCAISRRCGTRSTWVTYLRPTWTGSVAIMASASPISICEELRARLWPAGTLVEYDQGLNAAVNRLRDALGDSAEVPRFIETLPKRGYRFIAAMRQNER